MTTASQAFTTLRGILEGGGLTIPLRWQNEDADSLGVVPLPDVPAPFIYSEFTVEMTELIGTGGGRGANIYRNYAVLDIYVFVPRGSGSVTALNYAESAAVLFRSHRDSAISCFEASVRPGGAGSNLSPPGLASEVANYFWAAVEIELFFDGTG